MSLLRPLGLVLASLFALSACATPPPESAPETSAGTDEPAFAEAPPPPELEDEGMLPKCNAEAGQWAVGQLADEALVAKVQADTQSQRLRVIKPGMMVTMDYREDRVNIEVDADNRVTVVRCG